MDQVMAEYSLFWSKEPFFLPETASFETIFLCKDDIRKDSCLFKGHQSQMALYFTKSPIDKIFYKPQNSPYSYYLTISYLETRIDRDSYLYRNLYLRDIICTVVENIYQTMTNHNLSFRIYRKCRQFGSWIRLGDK